MSLKIAPLDILQRYLRDPMYSRFGTVPACVGRTGEKTDRWTHDDSIYSASRGKNANIVFCKSHSSSSVLLRLLYIKLSRERKGLILRTRSSAITQGPRDARCQLKYCHLLHKCTKNPN